MQQRQPRLGDILDDYCPRERRLTNHVVVAMIGDAVKQTRCTTCDADHEYKHAAVPRQRKKSEQSALYSQVLASTVPKRVVVPSSPAEEAPLETEPPSVPPPAPPAPVSRRAADSGSRGAADFEALFAGSEPSADGDHSEGSIEEGPAHRRLIRAQLPRHEGQVSTSRQAPDFTIRQPTDSRAKRFSGRHRGGGMPQSDRQGGLSSHNGSNRGGQSRGNGRPGGGRPGTHRSGGGRNRSK